MIINGKEIAQQIQNNLINIIQDLSIQPTLHIFVVVENPVIENFIKYKSIFAKAIGVEFVEHRFNDDITEQELIDQITKATKIEQVTPGLFGVVIQLPLPEHIDTQRVLDAVPAELDIDGLATGTKYLPPVAGAVREIFEFNDINVNGKNALVIGRGKLVGKPVVSLLEDLGTLVTNIDKDTTKDELTALSKQSDVIISGAGVPNLVTEDMIKEGVILLDAGTSTQSGTLVGDISHDCESKAKYFAQTPGGIGPITIAVLFKNLIMTK